LYSIFGGAGGAGAAAALEGAGLDADADGAAGSETGRDGLAEALGLAGAACFTTGFAGAAGAELAGTVAAVSAPGDTAGGVVSALDSVAVTGATAAFSWVSGAFCPPPQAVNSTELSSAAVVH